MPTLWTIRLKPWWPDEVADVMVNMEVDKVADMMVNMEVGIGKVWSSVDNINVC